jgi:hypothetical protein
MPRKSMIVATVGAMLALASGSFAQQGTFGTPDEAKALLTKAVAAVKADKAKGLETIAKVDGGFRDRDLYPYCFNLSDGTLYPFANPNLTAVFGKDYRTLKDPKGFNFGQAIFDKVTGMPEGQVAVVGGIMLPKPGPDTTPVPKTVFITKVGDLGCGVGYYD